MTSAKPKIIVLKQGLLTRANNSEKRKSTCNLCDGQLMLNEEIVTKRSARGSYSYFKWYHVKCANQVNLI